MIGASKQREKVEALRADMAALTRHVATLVDQISDLAAQLMVEQNGTAQARVEVADLQERLAELEGIVQVQSEMLRSQAAVESLAGEVAKLRRDDEGRAEDVRQLRADLARVERQAAIDLAEMRRTSTAVAASVLLRRAPGESREGSPT